MPGDGFYPAPQPAAEPPKDPAKPATKLAVGISQKGTAASAQKPPDPQPPEPKPPMGSYDAIRVYLWAGMVDPGRTRTDLVGSLSGMGAYLSSADHRLPPEKVSALGMPETQDGPVGFSAAVLPYLRANEDMSRAAAQQRVRISAQLDSTTGLYGKNPVYYDQNLVLFAMGYLDGRFRFGPGGELKVEWTR
jgi:endoglucanase